MSGPVERGEVPAIRASDAERDEAVSALREHALAGRLTLEEFSGRIEKALSARTRGELETLGRDLPVPGKAAVGPARRRPTRWSVAVMGGIERKGRWRPSARTAAITVMGGCVLDLRNAEIDGPEVVITVITVMGGAEVIVPEGVEVEVGGLVLMGGREERLSDAPVLPGTPLVRIRAFGLMGGVTVRNKPLHTGRPA